MFQMEFVNNQPQSRKKIIEKDKIPEEKKIEIISE